VAVELQVSPEGVLNNHNEDPRFIFHVYPLLNHASAERRQIMKQMAVSPKDPLVRSIRAEERDISTDDPFDFRTTQTVLVARQNLAELRSERAAYHSALALVSELQRGKRSDSATIRGCVLKIVENVSEWPQQWQRERHLRASGQGYGTQPTWLFQQDNLEHPETWKYFATRERSGDPMRDALSGPDPIRAGHNVLCELINAFGPRVYAWGQYPS
jgi:hypothetical protein